MSKNHKHYSFNEKGVEFLDGVVNLIEPKHFKRFGMLLQDKTSRSVMQLTGKKMSVQEISIELKLDEDVVKDILKDFAEIGYTP